MFTITPAILRNNVFWELANNVKIIKNKNLKKDIQCFTTLNIFLNNKVRQLRVEDPDPTRSVCSKEVGSVFQKRYEYPDY